MVKQLNNKKIKHDRIENMKRWTAEDYEFYQSFFHEVFKDDSKEPVDEEEEAFIKESYRRFMEKVEKMKEKL